MPQRHEGTVDALTARDITGCFALTEMAHGSDAKATRTTATYDPKAEEFVIHTPDFEAAKAWWVGLGFGLKLEAMHKLGFFGSLGSGTWGRQRLILSY